MKYKILISESARKQLNSTGEGTSTDPIQSRRVGDISEKRRARADIKKLHDVTPELYRLRVGSFRIVYVIVGDEVRVTEIMRRGRDYRGY
jgi:mRNA-degrading endonuclease RelE of RelBE toxin-antitoxin system